MYQRKRAGAQTDRGIRARRQGRCAHEDIVPEEASPVESLRACWPLVLLAAIVGIGLGW